MVSPFPATLSVYHDEFNLMIIPSYLARGIDVLPLVNRAILIGYPNLDYLVSATGVLAPYGTHSSSGIGSIVSRILFGASPVHW